VIGDRDPAVSLAVGDLSRAIWSVLQAASTRALNESMGDKEDFFWNCSFTDRSHATSVGVYV